MAVDKPNLRVVVVMAVDKPNSPVPVGDETEALRARLYQAAERWLPGVDFAPDLLREAADTLARVAGLEAKNEELRKALAPFIPAGPRMLSIGSIDNTVEIRVSREAFDKAKDLLND